MDDDEFTLRYVTRFQCIGPACEEHCCGGWRIEVDGPHHEKLKLAAGQQGSDRARIRGAFEKKPPEAQRSRQRGKPPPTEWLFKSDDNGDCVLLEPDRRCHIHATLGPQLLPDVCAIYPRRSIKMGDSVQITAALSCPEAARLALLSEDAVDRMPFEKEHLPRRVIHFRVDPREVRPSVRFMPEARAFAWRRLSDADRPFAHRMFAVTLLAHRLRTVLTKERPSGGADEVREEIARVEDPAVLDEIGRRFDAFTTQPLPVLYVARELVRGGGPLRRRSTFQALVAACFDTYAGLDVDAFRDGGARSADAAMAAAIQASYATRRDRLLALLRPRIETYERNFALHMWVHHLQTGAPDLFAFTLRLWLHVAAIRFLFYSHPQLAAWLALHPAGADVDDEALADLRRRSDEAIVEVVRKLSRYIEHSRLMSVLEKVLQERDLYNLGGAVHLIQF